MSNPVANLPHGLVTDAIELRFAIEKQWNDRAAARELKPGTMTYRKAEVEFFTGAMAALNAVFPNNDHGRLSPVVPSIWPINALRGRPIVN